MDEMPDQNLDDTRAALAPTLDAMASILPWVGKRTPRRFPLELNQRWQAGCKALEAAWTSRAAADAPPLRPAIFSLLNLAIESADTDCLYLAEALATVADHLEQQPASARLIAALSATCEALLDGNGLENPQLASRAQHFASRLNDALQPSHKPGERSDVVDALFVDDTFERLDHMREALLVLPIDIYALELDSAELIAHAEQIEMWGIYHQGRELHNFILQLSDASTDSQDKAAESIAHQLDLIEQTLCAVDS